MPKEKATTEKKEDKKAPKKVKAKKKVIRQVSHACVYIQASFNNTIVTFTDSEGNVLGWSSAGVVGFKGPKKATPYAASMIVKDVADKLLSFGIKEVSVYVRGIGGGREGAVRALNTHGFFVKTIQDVTPLPHNGCRPPKPRRV